MPSCAARARWPCARRRGRSRAGPCPGPGSAQNAVALAEAHAEVAVGDAAVEGLGLARDGTETGGEALDDFDQISHHAET